MHCRIGRIQQKTAVLFYFVLVSFVFSASLGSNVAGAESLFQEGQPSFVGKDVNVVGSGYPNFAELVRQISPAVVNISGETILSDSELEGVEDIPAPGRDPARPSRSLGSGFIVNDEGFIVTNNHVIDSFDRIVVRLLDDEKEYIAKVVGKDTKTDIALLKIDPEKKLPTVYLGDSDTVEVGEWVVAIGNQFQLGQTVTAGIVSAKARRVPLVTSGPYDNFLQTDASINPGSSGGPLLNSKGQVIGVNTAIFSPGSRSQFGASGFNIGIGFAAPINLVKGVVSQLKEHGRVTRGLLGVIIQRVDADVAEALGLPNAKGALIADIMPNSPAGNAGIERKDVIVKFGGREIKNHDELPLLVADTPVGTVVEMEVVRDGKLITFEAKIDELKEIPLPGEESAAKPDLLGAYVQDVTEEIARALGLEQGNGVIISGVQPGSVAERAGLVRGDIILEIGERVIKGQADYLNVIEELPKGKPVLALIRRQEGTRFVLLKR